MATTRFELLSLFRFIRYYVGTLMATTTNAFVPPSRRNPLTYLENLERAGPSDEYKA